MVQMKNPVKNMKVSRTKKTKGEPVAAAAEPEKSYDAENYNFLFEEPDEETREGAEEGVDESVVVTNEDNQETREIVEDVKETAGGVEGNNPGTREVEASAQGTEEVEGKTSDTKELVVVEQCSIQECNVLEESTNVVQDVMLQLKNSFALTKPLEPDGGVQHKEVIFSRERIQIVRDESNKGKPNDEKDKPNDGKISLKKKRSFLRKKSSVQDPKTEQVPEESQHKRELDTVPIQATVQMLSGCQDSQTSADISNVADFKLPDPAGRASGACTAALLKTLYAERRAPTNDLSFVEVLNQMRDTLREGEFTQIPQLSSSQKMDIHTPFTLVPPECTGAKRAILIGINYVGQQGELSGCHNDVLNMKEYIMNVWGFPDENITVIMDDGQHKDPTRKEILNGYVTLVEQTKSGDAVFCHFSGHGGKLPDDNGDEEDGYDETLIPVDYQKAGQIRDDELFTKLVGAMPTGAYVTCLMDCCHSGTVLDLPYTFEADGTNNEIQSNDKFDAEKLGGHMIASAASAGKCGCTIS